MEKKKLDLGAAAAGAAKATTEAFSRAKSKVVSAIDQNNDGELNLKDVSHFAAQWGERRDQSRRESERKNLAPIFLDDLDEPEFLISKLIRVAEADKKHADSEVCQGSIGYLADYKELQIVNIYPENVSAFGLSFYPDLDSEIYYVDPCDRDHYIALDNYFNYLRIVRVNELQKIAQDLGARHFRVTYKEQRMTTDKKKAAVKATAKQGGNVAVDTESVSHEFEKAEIAAEMEFIGHQPTEPQLVYLKKDPNIQNLVAMRLSDNTITHQKITIALTNSSGMKEKDAVKIDSTLKALKWSASGSITREAQLEARRLLEYEIDF